MTTPPCYFWDSNQDRSQLWQALGFTKLPGLHELADSPPDAPPSLLLAHASDLAKAIETNKALLLTSPGSSPASSAPPYTDPAEFLHQVRTRLSQRTACLYISGAGDGWSPLTSYERPSPDDTWTHVHHESVLKGDTSFQGRLQSLLAVWVAAGCQEPPDWSLLSRDWTKDAMDYVTAVRLLCHRQDDLREFLSSHATSSPFTDQNYGTGIEGRTQEERRKLDSLRAMVQSAARNALGDATALATALDEAIRFLRGLREA